MNAVEMKKRQKCASLDNIPAFTTKSLTFSHEQITEAREPSIFNSIFFIIFAHEA